MSVKRDAFSFPDPATRMSEPEDEDGDDLRRLESSRTMVTLLIEKARSEQGSGAS
jgi:hypothetical protein